MPLSEAVSDAAAWVAIGMVLILLGAEKLVAPLVVVGKVEEPADLVVSAVDELGEPFVMS